MAAVIKKRQAIIAEIIFFIGRPLCASNIITGGMIYHTRAPFSLDLIGYCKSARKRLLIELISSV
jgi:hypothetical protein